jgi:hypothetical protein
MCMNDVMQVDTLWANPKACEKWVSGMRLYHMSETMFEPLAFTEANRHLVLSSERYTVPTSSIMHRREVIFVSSVVRQGEATKNAQATYPLICNCQVGDDYCSIRPLQPLCKQ